MRPTSGAPAATESAITAKAPDADSRDHENSSEIGRRKTANT